MSGFDVVDIRQLAPADMLLNAAKSALHDHYNYSNYEQSEKIMDDLREAIRRVQLQPGPNGWIIWNGGPCPVPHETIVDISRACGVIETSVVAGHYSWGHIRASADRDITSFRIVSGAIENSAAAQEPDAPDAARALASKKGGA